LLAWPIEWLEGVVEAAVRAVSRETPADVPIAVQVTLRQRVTGLLGLSDSATNYGASCKTSENRCGIGTVVTR
jgi:hypothetical protein